MKRNKSLERYFYAVDFEKNAKSKLSKKQFLVYTYLMSVSMWDADSQENHYYVYKNRFSVKDATEKLKISQPTWRTALQKLEDEHFIKIEDRWYEIYFPESFSPLNIKLISLLLDFSCVLTGGSLVGLYSTLYKYWKHCHDNKKTCTITINQMLALFEKNHSAANGKYYEVAMAIFETQGLMTIKRNIKRYVGQNYVEYEIKFVNTMLPKDLENRNYGTKEIE